MADGADIEEQKKREEQELAKLDSWIEGFRTTNLGLMCELEQIAPVDTGHARIEHAMEFLENAGIITRRQRLEEQLAWEKSLRKQLVPLAQRAREMIAERQRVAREQAVAQKAAAQRGQKRSSLILPGGAGGATRPT